MSAKRTQPSDRQQEIADAVRAHGSMAAAAKAIGRTRQTVETTLARYHERVCDRRIEELEAELAAQRERDNKRIAAERQRGASPVSHRRIADGGIGGRKERRAACGPS